MQVSRWGNSLAVRLPRKLVDELGLKEGDEVTVVAHRPGEIEVATTASVREKALERMAQRKWARPAAFVFDRQDANER